MAEQMTYRQRREARAERLRGWAEKREQKAAQAFEQADRMASVIPFGQPILVGHYSEGRDRRYRDRIDSKGRKGVEHAQKAREMASKAANIEAAAERAIYSDDPNAVERLQERIAELEAERDAIKAENAAFRKAHKSELAAMTAYQRDQVLPHPSYRLTNLSGNIKRNRDRLAQLTK